MPSVPREALASACLDFSKLVRAAVPSLRDERSGAQRADGDDLAARAVASVGLAALLCLPMLMLASVVFRAPVAVPAAIACGYLAIAHALASRQQRRAAIGTGIVLTLLVGWLVLHLLSGDAALSRAGIAAAMMAPLLAAAPALARSWMAPRESAATDVPQRAEALERVRCLDMHAPGETVVIADREGMVLAATGSAHAYLRLLPDAFEQHLASLFSSADAPRLRSAIRRCGREGGSVDLIFPREAWVLSPCQGGMLSLRLVRTAPQETPRADCPLLPEAECRGQGAALRCDVEDAVTFALHRARSGAEEKRLSLSRGVAYGLAALCDRQAARRIVHLAVQEALADAPRESAIRVDARRVRGIVLLQIASETKVGEEDCDVAVLRSLVEDAGGTLVIDRHKGNQVLSIRLGAADVGKDEESDRADRC